MLLPTPELTIKNDSNGVLNEYTHKQLKLDDSRFIKQNADFQDGV